MSDSSVLRQLDRVQVASFSTYSEAESAVDYLSDRKSPSTGSRSSGTT